MLGEVWIWVVEGFRVGNGHMSYRGDRLFWARHRFELFAAALLIFWLGSDQCSTSSTLGAFEWTLTGVSDNVGGVKHVATTLPHALEQERHFALIGEVLNPRLAS